MFFRMFLVVFVGFSTLLSSALSAQEDVKEKELQATIEKAQKALEELQAKKEAAQAAVQAKEAKKTDKPKVYQLLKFLGSQNEGIGFQIQAGQWSGLMFAVQTPFLDYDTGAPINYMMAGTLGAHIDPISIRYGLEKDFWTMKFSAVDKATSLKLNYPSKFFVEAWWVSLRGGAYSIFVQPTTEKISTVNIGPPPNAPDAGGTFVIRLKNPYAPVIPANKAKIEKPKVSGPDAIKAIKARQEAEKTKKEAAKAKAEAAK